MKKLLITILITLLFVKNKVHGQELSTTRLFSTYYGSIGTDDADVVAVDLEGNTYLGCHSSSANLPGFDKHPYTLSGGMDAFIVKLNNTGTEVCYLRQFGGSKWDAVQGIISDSKGFIYAVGTTYSPDFPIQTNGFQPNFGGKSDAFVLKLDQQGRVIWSTFLGGDEDEDGRAIILDEQGKIYVVGRTKSKDFPTTDTAMQPKLAGGTDAFVTTLNTNGKVLASTYLGGSKDDIGFSIALDNNNHIYIAGTTSSSDFPTKNSLQSKNNGGDDAFLTVIDPLSSVITFSSYIGGAKNERLYNIDLDTSGNAYLMGFTYSSDYPTTQEAFQSKQAGLRDVYISKLDLLKRKLVYSTYIGGSNDDSPKNLMVNKDGIAYIIGSTNSMDFPTTSKKRVNLPVSLLFLTYHMLSNFSTIISNKTMFWPCKKKLSCYGGPLLMLAQMQGPSASHIRDMYETIS